VIGLEDFEVGEYVFEWDDEKAEINKRKHKVMFSMAAKVFLDDYRIDDYDELHSDDEERRKVIGRVGKILRIIMDNFRIYKGMPFTKEELECLAELEKMTDEDIDYSDIPPLTDEELARMKPARLRRKKLKIAG